MTEQPRIKPWTIQADLGALVALKNNRDRIYFDAVVGELVTAGAQQRALDRADAGQNPTIVAEDVAASMRAANLEFRTTEYVSEIVKWAKPEVVPGATWGD